MIKLSLLVGFYRDPVPARMAELITCLERNTANDYIVEMFVFAEDAEATERLQKQYPVLTHPKIRVIAHGRRTCYADFFTFANRHLVGKVIVVANADIYFDGSLALLADIKLRKRLLCLSRWDVLADGRAKLFDQADSQDAWIFQSPIQAFLCNFQLGQLGCDNRLAWEAKSAGLKVSNPCRSVHAYHLHISAVRRRRERLTGRILLVPPCALGDKEHR